MLITMKQPTAIWTLRRRGSRTRSANRGRARGGVGGAGVIVDTVGLPGMTALGSGLTVVRAQWRNKNRLRNDR
jgi:hypothetical protein